MSDTVSRQRQSEPRSRIDSYKGKAKCLLRDYGLGKVEAVQRVEKYWTPREGENFALHDAQWVIARESSCETWQELKQTLESDQRDREKWLNGPPISSFRLGAMTITTTRLQESKEFYTSILGFELRADREDFVSVFFRKKRLLINFMSPRNDGHYGQHRCAQEPFQGAGISFDFIVPDMYKAYEFARSRNVPIASGPETLPWGEMKFSIYDPNGITVYLTHPWMDEKVLEARIRKLKSEGKQWRA